ncbi:hypothetical protein [Pseudaminobacter soli (ex Li et al. 2025)]|uniref:hypothetical protein n=1 Tax=Pseudaminobacter soli (ex Li et al. 2025) TaxID=1295366 RepID=UPI0015E78AA9|nr:hypothetical protein [Mesorhizobium soli]
MSLKQECQSVVDIPNRDLTVSEVARLWGKDRLALGECARRHDGLSKAVEALEGQGK